MASQGQPYREPIRTTLWRTGVIAIVAGGVVARFWGGFAHWPLAALLALWPAFGGHWVEVWFLYWLRPRISDAHRWQIGCRVCVWFVGGMGLAVGAALTARAVAGLPWPRTRVWAMAGFAFVGIELAVHLMLRLRGRPSFIMAAVSGYVDSEIL